MFAEHIAEISLTVEDITFTQDFRVFPDIFEIFAEDCFLLRSFRKFLPAGFYPEAVSSLKIDSFWGYIVHLLQKSCAIW